MSLLREFLLSEVPTNSTQNHTQLHIATTRCIDGKPHIFSFHDFDLGQRKRILTAVEASTKIPISFHPFDVLPLSSSTYDATEGIEINGESFVDGGIAMPAPPLPEGLSNDYDDDILDVVVSPIAGSSRRRVRVSPPSSPWRFGNFFLPDDFGIELSITNYKAGTRAAGLINRYESEKWYQRGQDDVERFLENYSKESRKF